MTTELVPAVIHQRAVSLIEQARSLQITDQASLDVATNYLGIEADLRKKIQVHHAENKKKTRAAWQEAIDMEKRALRANGCTVDDKEPGLIRATLSPKIIAFQSERRRRVLEEQTRRQEEENRKAEDRRLAEAAALAEQGVSEADVDAVLEAPIVPQYVPPPEPTKIGGGVTERWEYAAEVIDLLVLLRAVVAGRVPLSAVEPSTKYLNSRARSDKENFDIPGCRLLKSADLTVRRQR